MWCCFLFPAVFGIFILINGRVMLTYNRKVSGLPARIIGVLLLLPFPMTLFGAVLLGAYEVILGKQMSEEDILNASIISAIGSFALCFLAVISIALVYSERIHKRDVEDAVEVMEVPDDYGEHFQANDRRRSAPRAEDTDRMDEPPHSLAPPDDRIQPGSPTP